MGLISALASIGSWISGGALAATTATGTVSAAAAIAGGATLVTAGVGVASMTGAFSPGMPSSQALAPGPTQTADQIIAQSQATAAEEKKDLIRAKRRKTVLTGPTGLFEEADTAQKTLLGA